MTPVKLPTWADRALHSAITAYVVFALVIGLVVINGQRQQDATSKRANAAQALFNAKICTIAHASWDERDALVKQLTEHAVVPQGIDIGSAKALQQLVKTSNDRKDREKTLLLKIQGPRPVC